jgi:hypothetical protein
MAILARSTEGPDTKWKHELQPFVTALLAYCSTKNHRVKDYIKYYELWNEANDETFYWDGTETRLYQMVKPAVGMIWKAVSGAYILTPSVNDCNPQICPKQTVIPFEMWQENWLGMDSNSGRISDIYTFRTYLDSLTRKPSSCLN